MIGIICAMQIEADGIIALCSGVKTENHFNMTFNFGRLCDKDVVVVVCGVGKVNAAMCATVMIERFSPDVIVNSGVAGAVSPLVKVGDIVVATKSVEHDMNTSALGYRQGEVSFPDGEVMYFECDKKASRLLEEVCRKIPDTKVESGVIASGDIFISALKQRLRINSVFSALACEMEGAAIGHVCFCCKTPYAIIRAISDDLSENEGVDFVKFCDMASKKTVSAIEAFVREYKA